MAFEELYHVVTVERDGLEYSGLAITGGEVEVGDEMTISCKGTEKGRIRGTVTKILERIDNRGAS